MSYPFYRISQFDDFCDQARALFLRKNEEYGDAIATTGLLGAIVEIVTVAARLKQLIRTPELILTDAEIRKEVIDKLLDSHNYSNIALMMLEDGNADGENYGL